MERRAQHRRRASRYVAATALVAAGALAHSEYFEQLKPFSRISPVAQSQTHDDSIFSVLTANVHGWKSVTGEPIAPALMDVVTQTDPDAICIQEDKKNADAFHDFLGDQGYSLYFSPTVYYPWRDVDGNMLAVKHASEFQDIIDIPDTTRTLIDVEIPRTVGQPVELLCGHLSYKQDRLEGQIELLNEHKKKLEDETIAVIAGDFNMNPKTLRDKDLVGFGGLAFNSNLFTYDPDNDGDGPVIDYILGEEEHTETVGSQTFHVNSDHRALYVELELTDIIGA